MTKNETRNKMNKFKYKKEYRKQKNTLNKQDRKK